jgi:hypothetical protein
VDFIERYLGFSPDNGNSSLELMALVFLVALAMLIGMILPLGGKSRDPAGRDSCAASFS